MKKFGFTLAEILITLGVVGVVAALTLPTFIMSTKDKANVAKLSKTVSEFETAVSNMLHEEEMMNIASLSTGQDLFKTLTKYYKVSLADNYKDFIPDSDYKITYLTGNKTNFYSDTTLLTKSGAIINLYGGMWQTGITQEQAAENGCSLYDVEDGFYDVLIDVNGKEKPNKMSRDIFAFVFGPDGRLYPYGGRDVSFFLHGDLKNTWRDEGGEYPCTNTAKGRGEGCTARLIEDGFEIKY